MLCTANDEEDKGVGFVDTTFLWAQIYLSLVADLIHLFSALEDAYRRDQLICLQSQTGLREDTITSARSRNYEI